MRKKWEYGIVHIDSKTGFLLADMFKTPMSMEDVRELATEGTGDCKGTYAQGEWLRIAGSLGWEMVCPYQDKIGWHWLFKREIEK
jgi:hypothetical protein